MFGVSPTTPISPGGRRGRYRDHHHAGWMPTRTARVMPPPPCAGSVPPSFAVFPGLRAPRAAGRLRGQRDSRNTPAARRRYIGWIALESLTASTQASGKRPGYRSAVPGRVARKGPSSRQIAETGQSDAAGGRRGALPVSSTQSCWPSHGSDRRCGGRRRCRSRAPGPRGRPQTAAELFARLVAESAIARKQRTAGAPALRAAKRRSARLAMLQSAGSTARSWPSVRAPCQPGTGTIHGPASPNRGIVEGTRARPPAYAPTHGGMPP